MCTLARGMSEISTVLVPVPAHAAFLAAVNQGQMPAELIGEDGDAEGDVHIIDKSGEVHLRQCVRGEGEGGREGGRGT